MPVAGAAKERIIKEDAAAAARSTACAPFLKLRNSFVMVVRMKCRFEFFDRTIRVFIVRYCKICHKSPFP
jgi:hypothetical protein